MTTSLTAFAGQTSQTFPIGIGATVTLTPASTGGTGYIETTTSNFDAVNNNTATWYQWASGSVSTVTSDIAGATMQGRLVCTSGSMSVLVGDGGAMAYLNNPIAPWKKQVVSLVQDQFGGTALVASSGGVAIGTRTTPLRVATFGDSTGNSGSTRSVANQDTTQTVNANWGATYSGGITSDRYALDGAYPQAYLVMNGGITGQSTTQMLARDTLAASVTRRAITDVIASAPEVVLLCGGSINDLLTVTSATVSAQIATTYANHIRIIQRFVAAKIPVIDVGIYGFTNGSANTATDQAVTRSALVQLNAMYAAYAAQYLEWVRFVPSLGVVSDSSGAYLPGMSTDGTHLNRVSQLLISQPISQAISQLFGSSSNHRYKGTNLFTNAMFANVSGGLATGITTGGTNTTPGNQQIQVINGAVWQTVDYAINATSNTSILKIAYTPQSYGLTAGDLVGMEVDILIQGLSGYSPTVTGLTLRNSTFITGGAFRTECDMMAGASNGEQISSYVRHINFPPTLFGVSSSGLGTNSSIDLNVQTNDTSGTIRLGFSNPRIVKLNNSTVVDQGSATLVAGTVTVANTNVFAGAEIVVTCITPGGTPGALFVGTITNYTSFVMNSTSASDTSIVRWEIRGFTG